MSAHVCPYLGAADNPDVYVTTPDSENTCYSAGEERSVAVPVDYQERFCLADEFERCSRYQAAETAPTPLQRRHWLMLGGGLLALFTLVGCTFLVVLTFGSYFADRTADVTATLPLADTPSPAPTLTPTPILTPTATLTPTVEVTATPTATLPLPPSESPTAWETPTFPATPSLIPTYTRAPTWTPRPQPTARPTSTRGPTWTPRPTNTPFPTFTPRPSYTPTPMSCRVGDTMTFSPTNPFVGDSVSIEVRSLLGYTDISLVPDQGSEPPTWDGLGRDGSYYWWRWTITYITAGSRTYRFKIDSGALTCASGTVNVAAGTDTPTPTATNTATPTYTATPIPVYGVALSGDTHLTVVPGETATFDVDLHNTGNVEDTFNVGLKLAPPTGWGAKFCIGNQCFDYTSPPQPVTVGADQHALLQVKLIAPLDAPIPSTADEVLWVQSQTDQQAYAEHAVQALVVSPP